MTLSIERNRGFTLFEVLVALAVAAVALTAAVHLIGVYVANSAKIQERVYAHWVASNLLVASQLDDPWPDVGIKDGETTLGAHDWRWRRAVAETPFATVRRVEYQVFSTAGADDAAARLSGYVGEKVRW
jgi:general secretion pathway protein I